jgi:hypothetical protein
MLLAEAPKLSRLMTGEVSKFLHRKEEEATEKNSLPHNTTVTLYYGDKNSA